MTSNPFGTARGPPRQQPDLDDSIRREERAHIPVIDFKDPDTKKIFLSKDRDTMRKLRMMYMAARGHEIWDHEVSVILCSVILPIARDADARGSSSELKRCADLFTDALVLTSHVASVTGKWTELPYYDELVERGLMPTSIDPSSEYTGELIYMLANLLAASYLWERPQTLPLEYYTHFEWNVYWRRYRQGHVQERHEAEIARLIEEGVLVQLSDSEIANRPPLPSVIQDFDWVKSVVLV